MNEWMNDCNQENDFFMLVFCSQIAWAQIENKNWKHSPQIFFIKGQDSFVMLRVDGGKGMNWEEKVRLGGGMSAFTDAFFLICDMT